MYVENLEEFTKKQKQKKLIKVIEYKVKAQNTIIYLYSSNSWNKNIKIILFQ